jgi:hypothetical protein
VVNFTLRPLYPRGKKPGTHWAAGWVGPGVGLDSIAKRTEPDQPEVTVSNGHYQTPDLDDLKIVI